MIQMANKSIDDWIELLADRSKSGDIGEYSRREQCAEILGFLNELRFLNELKCSRLEGGRENDRARAVLLQRRLCTRQN